MTLHSHGVVVERRHAWQAARQAGRHVTALAVRADTVVAVDVGGVRHGFLQVSHTHMQNTGYASFLSWELTTTNGPLSNNNHPVMCLKPANELPRNESSHP